MGADRIEVRGLRVVCSIGLLDEERSRRQPIEISFDVEVDLERAGASDDLADTIDYAALVAEAVHIAEAGHHDLLESLADEIGRAALGADERIQACEVTVTKLRPPIAHDVATVGVRRRQER